MKTTRKQALKIYNIVKWVNPYEVCDLDKEMHLQTLSELDLIDNIKELNNYIKEKYDDPSEDKILIKKYKNLINFIVNNLKHQRVELLTDNNFERNSQVINQEKLILTEIEEVTKNSLFKD